MGFKTFSRAQLSPLCLSHRRLQNSKSTRAKDNNVGARSTPTKNGGVNYIHKWAWRSFNWLVIIDVEVIYRGKGFYGIYHTERRSREVDKCHRNRTEVYNRLVP